MVEFPVHEEIDVREGHTIFKSDSWWKAVVLYQGFREDPEIGVYLWKKADADWKRQQKYVVRSVDDWEQDKEVIEQLVAEL